MLFILKSNGEWEKVLSNVSTDFKEMHQKLIRVIELSNAKLSYPKEFETKSGNLRIDVIRIENKSKYNLIIIVQYNKITDGLRFLAYANISSKTDASVLKTVETSYVLSFCPYQTNIAHFI